MSLASSKSRAMVSPTAILMLTSSLSSNVGSLGRCLQNNTHAIIYLFIFLICVSILTFSSTYLVLGCSKTKTIVVEVNIKASFWQWVLLAQDVFDLAGSADGEQQCPGQQGVGVELACLGVDQRASTIHPSIGPGKQVLKALHGSMHVLKQEVASIIWRLEFAIKELKSVKLFPTVYKHFMKQLSSDHMFMTLITWGTFWVQLPVLLTSQMLRVNEAQCHKR